MPTPPAPQLGDVVRLRLDRVAHGGHMVGRYDGQVVFVRHGLPGEEVDARITGVEKRFLRADAIAVHQASADRVPAPCPVAGPDGCGGCDFQHVSLPAQRQLKADVVAEALQRFAGIERSVTVAEVEPTLRWRTRTRFVELPGGKRGMRKHRSHDVVEVEDCLIEAPDAATPPNWCTDSRISRPNPALNAPFRTERAKNSEFRVARDGFWQVHPAAPDLLVDTVLAQLDPQPGERAVDLYSGVGLFAAFLAERVGPDGSVLAVEGDREASAHARANLAEFAWAKAIHQRVDRMRAEPADLVVLDPPRAGAKRAVCDLIGKLQPRAISYVACDPVALARDLAYFAEGGYELQDLRAYDLFPMTHHVECVALLTPRDL